MLSVIMITKNEGYHLEQSLKAVEFADEIIVVDSGSQDNTLEIARRFTDKVYSYPDWKGYGVQKARALSHASQAWVLNIDADEVVTQELKNEILELIHGQEADAARLSIRLVFQGKTLRYTNAFNNHIRLFKREGAQYSDDIVHEKICLPRRSRVTRLPGLLLHFSYRDLSHALAKMNRYSSYTAKQRRANGQGGSLWLTLCSAGWLFFRTYILQKGFLDGKEGLLFAILNMEGAYYRGMKVLYPDK